VMHPEISPADNTCYAYYSYYAEYGYWFQPGRTRLL
jgi:hypothetical protein